MYNYMYFFGKATAAVSVPPWGFNTVYASVKIMHTDLDYINWYEITIVWLTHFDDH